MGSARALSQPQPCRVGSIWPGYHRHRDHHYHHHDHHCNYGDLRQVCSATDTERRSEAGGDVRVAIKKIARPFQVSFMMITMIICDHYKLLLPVSNPCEENIQGVENVETHEA